MQNDLLALKDKLSQAQNLVIFLAPKPTIDVMAAGLGLYLSLVSAGKKTSIICESEPLVRDSHLVGLDKLQQNISGQNLTLTVNIEGDVVDKVTSSVDEGKLSLTIIPKAGCRTITPSDIVFGSSGASYDLAICIDFSSPPPSFSKQTFLVNLSNQFSATGNLNFSDPNSSYSELVTAILQELHLPLNEDIAGNLMRGIEAATDNFQSSAMTADTFEALAVLYRAGARHQVKPVFPQATIIDNTPIIQEREQEDQKDIQAIEQELHQMTSPSPDWLKPKIYSSSDK